ncbi:hypothetical protein ACFX13_022086 [Malus domestica]
MRSLFQNLIGYLFLVSCSSAKDVPAFFTFGDSMVEVGNNNYLQTLAKANVSPFGIDFGKPTGRFTNGRTIFDIPQQVLGFKNFTPPYLAPTTVGDMLLQGVNYASSAAGIFNITGFYFIMEAAAFALSQDTYLDRLISTLRLELETLYNLDARNIIFSNVGLIGCIPFQKGLHLVAKGSCAGKLNQLAEKYNEKLKILLEKLNIDLEGANFIYADTYRMLQDITQNYVSYGFENANSGCCSMDGLGGGIIHVRDGLNFVQRDQSIAEM